MLQQTQNICTYSFVSIKGALGGWRAGSRLGQQPPLHQQIRPDMWRRKTPHQSILMDFEGGQQPSTNVALRQDGRFYTLQERTL